MTEASLAENAMTATISEAAAGGTLLVYAWRTDPNGTPVPTGG